MDIKRVPISDVEVWEKNPRNIKTEDFERLKKQIEELGVYKPLICYQENGRYVTLGGNMRLRALKELKHRDIDISIVKAKTEAMKIKYALSDNDRVGIYMEQELAELVYPYLEEINLEDFKIDIGEPIDLINIIESFGPDLRLNKHIPDIDYETDETFKIKFGFSNSSVWVDLGQENAETWSYLIHPPPNPKYKNNAIKYNYSRANPVAIERIIKLWMDVGDYFYEPCAGWATFSSIAKYFGFLGEALDNWDFSINFCKRSIAKMPGKGKVNVHLGDAMNSPFDDNQFDFIHMNPPFGNLEEYGGNSAGSGSYDKWLDNMTAMMFENFRVLKPGKFCVIIMADWRDRKILKNGHGDFINLSEKIGFNLHDLIICRIPSQSLRFSRVHYRSRHSAKAHEYILVFRKPEEEIRATRQ